MIAAELLLLAVLAFNAIVVLSIAVGIYFVAKTPDNADADASALPARTYDAALMQRQISKLQRVASQIEAPSIARCIARCTGKCNQGRNCTCGGQSKGQL